MWNNGMFNQIPPGMPLNPSWPANYQQQFNQWPMNQQWGQPRLPPIPFNIAPGWNQPRMQLNSFSQPPPPPLPSNGTKPSQPPITSTQPPPSKEQQPPPPTEKQPPPPPLPTERCQPPPPPGLDNSQDSIIAKKSSDTPASKTSVSKLNLNAPPPPPPPEENRKASNSNKMPGSVKNLQVLASGNQDKNTNIFAQKEVQVGRGGGRGSSGRGGVYPGDQSLYPKGRPNTNIRGRVPGNGNNQFGFVSEQGSSFIQDDNSEYDDGFNSNFDDMDVQHSATNEYKDSLNIQEGYQGVQTLNTSLNKSEADWKCSDDNCNESNFARRTECRKCRKPKDSGVIVETAIKAGDWKCWKCEEINFAKRAKCRRCNVSKKENLNNSVQSVDSPNNKKSSISHDAENVRNNPISPINQNKKLENFDKMFKNWEDNYEKWKTTNKENPDREYVGTYMAQMEAMRIQLLEKRKGLNPLNTDENQGVEGTSEVHQHEEDRKQKMIENWQSQSGKVEKQFSFIEESTDEVKEDFSARELAQKILGETSDDSDDEKATSKTNETKNKRSRWGNEGEAPEQKRSRWEIDPSDIVDIQDWRRRPENENGANADNLSCRPVNHINRNRFEGETSFQANSIGREFSNTNLPTFNNQTVFRHGQQDNQLMFERGNLPRHRGDMHMRGRGRGGSNVFVQGNQFNKTPEYQNFWKPTAVTDYSEKNNMPNSRRDVFVQREFKPETFDYSHGARHSASPATKPRHGDKQHHSWGDNGARNSHRQSPNIAISENLPSYQTPPPDRSSPPAAVKPAGNRVMIDSIISLPGRSTRPPKIVIILRGLPGSGKSHLSRLIKEKELEHGSEQPRTLALDDYFECDGQYEFDPEMEDLYRSNLIKSFKKNIDGGYFQFLIVDAINCEVDHFRSMWSYAKQNGFEVYICGVDCEASSAAARNVHSRSEKDVLDLARNWEETPPHMNTLDVRALLQDDAIEHFEMGEASDDVKEDTSEISQTQDDEEADDQSFLRASKWEILDKEEKMARLDGTTEKVRSKLAEHSTIEDWLELGEDYNTPARQGQKRVRWADIEQRKTQARVKELGFVVGQTNWANQRDVDSAASNALATTKIIPNRFQLQFHN